MNKRERVLKTLHWKNLILFQFIRSDMKPQRVDIEIFLLSRISSFQQELPELGYYRNPWWNADIWQMDPWQEFTNEFYPAPSEYPGALLHFTGRVYHPEPTPKPNDIYKTYLDGYYKSPE